jgi:hypothetical protein
MDLLGVTDPGVLPTEPLAGIVYGIIKLVAYGALGIVLIGAVTTCWCCFFECRKWRRGQGKSDVWRLIH